MYAVLLFIFAGVSACGFGADAVDSTEDTAHLPIVTLAMGWEYTIADSRDDSALAAFRPVPNEDLIHLADLMPDKAGWIILKNRFHSRPAFVDADLSLLAGRIIWNDIVHLNDQYLGGREQFGHPTTEPNNWNKIRLYRIPVGLLKTGEEQNTLTFRVYVNGEGSLSETPQIGETREMASQVAVTGFFQVQIHLLVSAILLMFGIYHLFIFWKRPVDSENLYYGLLLVGFALYETNFFLHLIPGTDRVGYLGQQKVIWGISQFALYSGILFVLKIVRERPGVIVHSAFAILMLGPVVTLFLYSDYRTFYEYRGFYTLSAILFIVVGIVCSIRGIIRRIPEARSLAVGVAILFVPIMYDTGVEILKIEVEIFLSAYGIPLFLGSMAFALANKFVNLHNEVEELNTGLERRVGERTQELNASLTHTQNLKERQDGDYFLTSLLLNPLGVNYAISETFGVEFFLRQKKQFRFRKHERDLGGDLCAAHTIHLQGQDYTVFMNADAMGKSMQGAGGALVLGSVFQSIIERTHINPREQTQSPEAWLKHAFVELHKVFVSFDGSMLVSLVMGLAEDRTGAVYYINAEHPAPIAYRDGKADFLESDVLYRKLGTTGVESRISIEVYRMQPGETLIFGSDGKDDVRIVDESGVGLINEDETLILGRIEQHAARPEAIYNAIVAESEIIDDFSLLCLEYQPGLPAADKGPEANHELAARLADIRREIRAGGSVTALVRLEGLQNDIGQTPIELLRLVIQCLVQTEDYDRAAIEVRRYLDIAPEDNEMLYAASVIYRRANDPAPAIELGERLRLREREDTRNLTHLARLHLAAHNPVRARLVLEEVLQLDPANSRAQNLLSDAVKSA